MEKRKDRWLLITILLVLALISGGCVATSEVWDSAQPRIQTDPNPSSQVADPINNGLSLTTQRIVILPIFMEGGKLGGAKDSAIRMRYRILIGLLADQLLAYKIEVLDPFARDDSNRELARVMQTAYEDTPRAVIDMSKKYAADAVLVIRIDSDTRRVKNPNTGQRRWHTAAVFSAAGYDSGARSLGFNMNQTLEFFPPSFNGINSKIDETVSREFANKVPRFTYVLNKLEDAIDLLLSGAERYETVHVFGKILGTVKGVENIDHLTQRIVIGNPQACFSNWRIEINPSETNPFQLQANIMERIKSILDARESDHLLRLSHHEIESLKGVRPADATSRSLQFVVDRELMRNH